MKKSRNKRAMTIAYLAISIALVNIMTMLSFKVSPDSYKNLGDLGIITISSFLGPFYGMISGAIGSALADVYLGYAYYAPFTIFIKGFEGFIVGLIVKKALRKFQDFENQEDLDLESNEKIKKDLFKNFIIRLIIAEILAFIIVVFFYFLAKGTMYATTYRKLDPKDIKFPYDLVKSAFHYSSLSVVGNVIQMSIATIGSFSLILALTKKIKIALK